MQVNLGYRCNQQCLHCHVNAGPKRKENMTTETVDAVIEFLAKHKIKKLDLTGGAPELNPEFRRLVDSARAMGIHVIDRCNLSILLEPGQEDLAEFLADHSVEVVASLPCYSEANVDGQRGKGVYEKSIKGLQQLNSLGYGRTETNLKINLVYNPTGPFLPPSQQSLEADYKRELYEKHDIVFNSLFTLANMPIQRFGSTLISRGEFDQYMQLLKSAHQPENCQQVMCLSLLSVNWQGYVYDCDFNQMLELPLIINHRPRTHIRDIDIESLNGLPIVTADHCYGCTAGQGSSCGGALA
jgi:radical SAM/Cys-rich protein